MCGTEIAARRALERTIAAAGPHGAGWWVLNTIPLRGARDNSDADLLVGIPNSGILIIEVKGWTEFAVSDEGRWQRRGQGNQMVNVGDGPFRQAQDQEYLLLELLQREQRELHLSGALPRIGSGVLFGNLSSPVIDNGQFPQDAPFSLFRDTFCPSSEPTQHEAVGILNRLRGVLGANAVPARRTDNSTTQLDAVRALLAPTRRLSGLAVFLDDSHELLNRVAEVAMAEVAHVMDASRLYVEGAAGTGKTVLALQIAFERSRRVGQPALYLCFSERLAAEIRSVQQYGPCTVDIFTPEELLVSVTNPETANAFSELDQKASAAAEQTARLLGTEHQPLLPRAYLGQDAFWESLVDGVAQAEREYSAIIVDEAQDLWDPAFSALETLVGPDRLFAIFFDPNQVTRSERAGRPWERPQSMDGATDLQLRRNFRNGDRIIDAVEECCPVQYERPARGPLPAEVQLLRYSNANPMQAVVAEHYVSLLDAGLDPVILTSGLSHSEAASLDAAGIKYESADSFKGLERRVVILVLGIERSPLDPNHEELYVGMTRATVFLSIIHHVADVHVPRVSAFDGLRRFRR